MAQNDIFEKFDFLGYRFTNPFLLEESLRHSSFVNEQNDKRLKSNERLEFLGDAVLNLAVSHLLMQRYPDTPEGTLSRIRSTLVNESQLAEIARSIGLGKQLCLGKGEIQSGGFEKASILADGFEALLAAVFLDGGYVIAFDLVQKLFDASLNAVDKSHINLDYKTRLQELVQLRQTPMPQYAVVEEIGPDHEKTFIVALTLGSIALKGQGKSKKAAEQNAAEQAFQILEKEYKPN